MLKLFSVKEKKEKEKAAGTAVRGVKQSAGELRLQKDMSELNLSKNISLNFPEGPEKMLHFEITIQPTEGLYRQGQYTFDFSISESYPHEAPKVKCKTKVFHPNIDLDGNVCLNILREDWKPVLSISAIIYGLQYLLADPNPEDPLNQEAATMMKTNERGFEQSVLTAVSRGTYINGHYFPPCVPNRK
eukprot:jgi/Botrbrau1/4003/Bobra.0016s0014.1